MLTQNRKRMGKFFLVAPSSLWDLSSLPEIELGPLAVKAQSPNCWTAREFPRMANLFFRILLHLSKGYVYHYSRLNSIGQKIKSHS